MNLNLIPQDTTIEARIRFSIPGLLVDVIIHKDMVSKLMRTWQS